ncbi:MAG: insulinase family protein [Sphingomonadales bacterium]|nr:insulinase family protein [Sphingomonadales bacterium]
MNSFARFVSPLALGLALVLAAPAAAADEPAPLAGLVAHVEIPFETATLKNGLRLIVHTDRKAPVVGVTTYYRVGSKHEPRGHTGFAHLYEHLFFGGSQNAPSFDAPLEAAGSTASNGSTWYDRTNYVETVPKGALELALFLESDRMGHLLGAVTQDKLDKQRGVVQNEKRQNDNQPYGLVQYAMGDGLFPIGHPYRHATIGSMADLDAATLGDVRRWFTDHYGPNNAVLVLTGDIDMATARPLVEKYFGDIPSGPPVRAVQAGPVTLAAPQVRELTDRVAMTRLYRIWTGPAEDDADTPALEVGMRVLGGLSSSRLDNALVRGRQYAVHVEAENEAHEQLSFLSASMDVKPGIARADAEAAFDVEIRRLIDEGPTADEVRRAATVTVSEQIGALELVGGMGGKGSTLAEGLLYAGDPAHYRQQLQRIASVTPEEVRAALQKWLRRPPLALAVTPGARTESGDQKGGWGDEATRPAPLPDPRKPVPALPAAAPRTAPPVLPVAALTFPVIQHARLSNGIPVTLARRTAVPKVVVAVGFDAGAAADALDTPGAQNTMLALLDEGTAGDAKVRNATQVAEEEERLGATITAGTAMDTSTVTLSALTANLAPSLALMADLIRHPAMAPDDVARVRQQRLAALAASLASPQSLALRSLNPLLYGAGHPYAQPSDGLGTAESLRAMTPASLRAVHDRWLRPDLARITVVGDVTMADLLPRLEAAFGNWQPPASPAPVKRIDTPVPAPRPRVVVLDRPQSPQSVIVGGRVLAIAGRDQGHEAVQLANEVLGGDFLSRLNGDLREDKGWSYGVETWISQPLGPRALFLFSPVQTDRTGDAIKALIADMKALPGAKPVTADEVQRVTDGNIRGLPNRFETNAQVLSAVAQNERLGRPDDYYVTLPDRYRAIGAPQLDAAARDYLQPEGMVFVVVGDKAAVLPQLQGLGLPVEVIEASNKENGT